MKEVVTIGESRCWERLRAGKEITEQVEGCKLEQLGHLENSKNDGFCRQPNNRLAVFFYTQYQKRNLDFPEIQIKGDTENINEGKQWNKRKNKRKRSCRTNLNCATAPIFGIISRNPEYYSKIILCSRQIFLISSGQMLA